MGKKNKIILIHTLNFFEQDGATANRWRTMVEGLAKAGFDIEIIFTQGYLSIKEFKKFGRFGKIKNISYSYTTYLLHNSLWMRRISGYILSPLFKKLNALSVRKRINEIKPEIIWLFPALEVFDLYLLISEHIKLPNCKLMIEMNEFHDVGLLHSTNRFQIESSKRYSKILLNDILPKMDLFLIMTKNLLNYYRQFADPSKAKILHLPMTVDMKRFNLKRDPKDRYIAYCGSSSFLKDGVDILIKSFAIIQKKYPGVILKIAAFMEADGRKMLALINELGLDDKINYVGELQNDKIPEFIINAEVLLLPRPDSKQAQGGFPTKLGEYLSTGNAVCATRVGEIPDYLADNESVFFAEPGSVDSFAEAMDRALSDPGKAKDIGRQGKKVAEKNFDIEVQAERLGSFINNQIIQSTI